MNSPTSNRLPALTALLIVLALFACSGPDLGPVVLPTLTLTPLPTLTETPVPLAISVNGEGITQAEFDAEVARYQAAQANLGKTVSQEEAAKAVQTDLIDTLLLAQGAAEQHFTVDDATLQSRIDSLKAQLGGPDALSAWETSHGYSDEEFRRDLGRQIAAAWMRDQIIASVPTSAEQVHVKQILLYNAEEAQSVLNMLQAGTDFNQLAAQYNPDPATQGELGWFPRGYLPEPAIEAAAFALQPGQYSDVIQTQVGYIIIMVVERSPARPLSPDALLTLQEHALQDWLKQRQQESTINPAP